MTTVTNKNSNDSDILNIKNRIVSFTGLTFKQVQNVLKLVDDDNTVHFIARYRKEMTDNIDENDIRKIIELRDKIITLEKARDNAIKNIEEQGKLTDELKSKLISAKTLTEIEDLYAPYKRKKKTKADIAREKGFGVIAKQIKKQETIDISDKLLSEYKREEIIVGAQDIVSQDIADDADLKELVRAQYKVYGSFKSKHKNPENFTEKQKQEVYKFKIYQEFSTAITKLKSYQILALNRGEDLGILSVSLQKDELFFTRFTNKIRVSMRNTELINECIKEGYKKIFVSVEREIRSLLTEKAEVDAIIVFQKNLKELLMLKPHYGESILAVDPGFRTGCKLCVLDKMGMPVEFSKIYLEKESQAIEILTRLVKDHNVDRVVIGNGTASNESYNLIKKELGIKSTIVNESGASVYSTSKVGQEEFPTLDPTDRGTVSIGRRYIDSLSELVKVPVISIGVGMYQHDMNQKELEKKLSEAVEDCVNLVGINLNTASPYLLSYVSGLSKKMAQKVVDKKPYTSRTELSSVLNAKAFQQSVGFLRLPESKEEFDNTGIHPEQYKVARIIISKKKKGEIINISELSSVMPGITDDVVKDIITNYENAGLELRQFEGNLKIQDSITIEDIKVNDIVTGVVRNITQFGAFVDIGLKNDGLIHISQLANQFVKDPTDIVSIGQEVKAKVITIDLENKKVGLSLKDV